jgi:hypothetical protein
MNLLAALRQLGRFLLMPFSATAAGSAVLALWRSGGWLLRRGFSIGTSVVLKKCYCAGRRLWPQMKCRGRHQGSVVGCWRSARSLDVQRRSQHAKHNGGGRCSQSRTESRVTKVEGGQPGRRMGACVAGRLRPDRRRTFGHNGALTLPRGHLPRGPKSETCPWPKAVRLPCVGQSSRTLRRPASPLVTGITVLRGDDARRTSSGLRRYLL